jgi:hypothetical protein
MPKVSASKKSSVLSLLEKSGEKGVTVQSLIKKCGKRSPARIYDLRRDGFNITTEPSRGPSCRYVLVVGKKSAKGKVAKNGKSSKGGKSA